VFLFFLKIPTEIFLIPKTNQWDMIQKVHMSSCKVPVILVRFEFSGQYFQKSSNIKFHENPPSGSRVVPCGHTDGLTDRQDEANSRFWQFWERALKKKGSFLSPKPLLRVIYRYKIERPKIFSTGPHVCTLIFQYAHSSIKYSQMQNCSDLLNIT
jgi:hypothetical protein